MSKDQSSRDKEVLESVKLKGEYIPPFLTDDTFVIGIVGESIVFIKSFIYGVEKEVAQKALGYVQKPPFTGWFISHAGGWKMSSKLDPDTQDLPIDIPLPNNL